MTPVTPCAGVLELVDEVDSKSIASDGVRVRVPPPVPRRSKLCIACSDFLQKSERTHAAAPPFQIEPAALGFDLVLDAALETAESIVALFLDFAVQRTAAPFGI